MSKNLTEVHNKIYANLLLSIETALEDDDPDGWLELVEFWEAWLAGGYVEADAKGYVY